MPKLDLDKAPVKTGSIYPAPYDAQMKGRSSLRLGDLGGLTQFGANIIRLAPGGKSSLRHHHKAEDEFVYMLSGTCTLVDDSGPQEMGPGDCAAFPAGDGNAHHFVNMTTQTTTFLVVGSKAAAEHAVYPDDNMQVHVVDRTATFTRLDGSPVEGENT